MIKKLIDNKKSEGTKYERILGSNENLNVIAEFWDKHHDLISLIATDELIKYCEEEQYNRDESAAFRAGLAKIGAVMQKCWSERELKIRQSLPQDSKE